jgi:hypothetical protein
MSGSIAVRGLRGVMRFGSVRFESMGAVPLAFAGCPDTGASLARGDAFAGSREYGMDAGAEAVRLAAVSRTIHASSELAERDGGRAGVSADLPVGATAGLAALSGFTGATRGGCGAGLAAAPKGLGRAIGGVRSPPPGGELDPVTAAFPLLPVA